MGLPGSGKTWLGSRIAEKFNIPFWDANIVSDVSSNKLKVIVYGETGQNVNWSVFFKLQEA